MGPLPCHHWPFLGLFPDMHQAASLCVGQACRAHWLKRDALGKAAADVKEAVGISIEKNFVSEN